VRAFFLLLLTALLPVPLTQAQATVQAQQAFLQGLRAAYADNHEEALKQYERAAQLGAMQAGLLYAQAQSHDALGDYATALFMVEQARFLDSTVVSYGLLQAQLQERTGQADAALITLQALRQQFPSDVAVAQSVSEALLATDQPAEALAAFQYLLTLTGEWLPVRQQVYALQSELEDAEGQVASLRLLIRHEPTRQAHYHALANLLVEAAKVPEAIAVLQDAIRVNPADAQAAQQLLPLYAATGQTEAQQALAQQTATVLSASPEALFDRARTVLTAAAAPTADDRAEAERGLRQVLAAAPDHPEAGYLLGTSLYARAAYDEAAPLLADALRQREIDLNLWIQTSAAHLRAGQPAEALRLADDGLLLFPGQLALLRVAGFAAMETYANRQAIDFFDRAYRISLESEVSADQRSEFAAALGLLYGRTDDLAASDDYYARALDHAPSNAVALHNYAFTLAERGIQLGEAQRMAQAAVEQEPDNPAFLDTLGWVAFKQGDLDTSAALLEQASAHPSASANTLHHYGDVLDALGRTDEARQFWQRAYDRNPANPVLQQKLDRP